MNKKLPPNVGTWLIFSFIGIALVTQFIHNPKPTLVFFAILAVVVLLYKFPPKWLISLTKPGREPKISKKNRKRKKYPFRVIDGKKKSS